MLTVRFPCAATLPALVTVSADLRRLGLLAGDDREGPRRHLARAAQFDERLADLHGGGRGREVIVLDVLRDAVGGVDLRQQEVVAVGDVGGRREREVDVGAAAAGLELDVLVGREEEGVGDGVERGVGGGEQADAEGVGDVGVALVGDADDELVLAARQERRGHHARERAGQVAGEELAWFQALHGARQARPPGSRRDRPLRRNMMIFPRKFPVRSEMPQGAILNEAGLFVNK